MRPESFSGSKWKESVKLMMTEKVFAASRMLLVMILLTGVVYPLTVTALAQVLFSRQANGSLVFQGDRMLGSELVGQQIAAPEYFHGRPSAAGRHGYDAGASSATNLGPTNKILLAEVAKRAEGLRTENGLPDDARIPADLATSSGSGLDPHITPESAYLQVSRIASVRGLPESRIRRLVDANIEGREFGFLGELRVNVLRLNRALDLMSR